jgi:hypothetical protein
MSHELQVMALRIVGALLIGGMIGLERSFHGRPGGLSHPLSGLRRIRAVDAGDRLPE